MLRNDRRAQSLRWTMEPWLPSDNEYGIPILNAEMQAVELPERWHKWGSAARGARRDGQGVFFYTEDYKVSSLVSKPWLVPMGEYAVAVEPNYSTGHGMPRAVALWGLYRKRWLARQWQDAGVRVLVDLAIEPCFYDLALLGVPLGWRAYATRALDSAPEVLWRDYELAREHAGTEPLLVVFGGHAPTAEMCARYGWPHVWEDIDAHKIVWRTRKLWAEEEVVGVGRELAPVAVSAEPALLPGEQERQPRDSRPTWHVF